MNGIMEYFVFNKLFIKLYFFAAKQRANMLQGFKLNSVDCCIYLDLDIFLFN